MDDSVRVHQRSDVPYGLFLSSGIDSSAILTAMAGLNSEPVRTYTAAFPETGVHDERALARAMAEAAGAHHTEVPITAATFFARLPEICAALDDPVADYAIVPMFLLAERAAQDVKVVLSGVGGDELFAGYSRYRRQMLPRWLGGRPRRRKGPCDGLDLFRHPLTGWRDGIAAAEAEAATHGFNALQRAQAVDFADWLPHSVLIGLDRCLMHFGLEGRTPLLDRDVVGIRLHPAEPVEAAARPGQVSAAPMAWPTTIRPPRPSARSSASRCRSANGSPAKAARLGPLVARAPGVGDLCRPETVAADLRQSGEIAPAAGVAPAVSGAMAPTPCARPPTPRRHVRVPRRDLRPRNFSRRAGLSGRESARNITGCAVKAGARGMDIGITTVGPIDEVRHRLQQGLA